MPKHLDCGQFCGWKHLSSTPLRAYKTSSPQSRLMSVDAVSFSEMLWQRCHILCLYKKLWNDLNLRRHAHFLHYHCIESRLMHMLADIVTEGRNICNNLYVHQVTKWEFWTWRIFNSKARKIDYQFLVFEILSFLEVQIRVKTTTVCILIWTQTQQKSFTSILNPKSQLKELLVWHAWDARLDPIVDSDLVIWTN